MCNMDAPNLLCKVFVHRHAAILETDRDVALCKNRQGVHVVGFDEKQRGGQVDWP